jgi:hypothetical protein
MTTGLVGCLGIPVAVSAVVAEAAPEAAPAATEASWATVRSPDLEAASRTRRTVVVGEIGTAVSQPARADVAPRRPTVKAVAGLSQRQMDNARRIVEVGQQLGLPRRAYILAVACAMQESSLHNLASDAVPESVRYPHEGIGSDHDSVGLFQQRSTTGWGPVRDLMKPAYAAGKFYRALRHVPGWEDMPLTYAIQAVQISAYPEAYAKHERAARQVGDAVT